MKPDTPLAIGVIRASVLTLWAAIVAQRLGYEPETAPTLGRFMEGASAHATYQSGWMKRMRLSAVSIVTQRSIPLFA